MSYENSITFCLFIIKCCLAGDSCYKIAIQSDSEIWIQMDFSFLIPMDWS